MKCNREHKQESRERWLERNLKPNDMASVAVATATSLVASHCLEIAEYMGAEHEQITTVVDSAINAKTNGDIMTLTAGAATTLRGAATLKARLKKGIGAITIPPIEDKCGEAKKASILTALDFVFQGVVFLKRTRKCNCLKNKYLYSLTNHVFSVENGIRVVKLYAPWCRFCQQYNSQIQSNMKTVNEANKQMETEKLSIVENLSSVRGHNGSVGSLGWWDLFINFSNVECFAFLVCAN
ncbi:unnamed protein product [Vicia faba]|uniref:VAN3-binding protein-like auxin canalisation domain-containing protein n=1 Tax=Vicia faba TaxID=3906 RepID=A0AAV0Z676_VICFA|nr:unnamed protein product [Vicia faba]